MGTSSSSSTSTSLTIPSLDSCPIWTPALFAELAAAAAGAGIAWVGGHTEVTGAVVSPVVVGAAVGVLEGEPWSSAGAQPGDTLVLTKWVALEGCTLLARERSDARAILGAEHSAVAGWLDDPGISVIAEGRVLRRFAIHAAHDPTEGGVAQGIHELAYCSDVAIEVTAAALPVKPATRRLCRALSIDPLGLLASGALLFTAPPEVARAAVAALQAAGTAATRIGTVRGPASRCAPHAPAELPPGRDLASPSQVTRRGAGRVEAVDRDGRRLSASRLDATRLWGYLVGRGSGELIHAGKPGNGTITW